MKRFCSWIILLVFTYLARLLLGLIITLTTWVLAKISDLSTVVYWIILIVYGGSIFSFLIYMFFGGAYLIVHTVQSIHESKTGARYIVVAIMNVLFTVFLIFGQYAGFVTGGSTLTMVAYVAHAILTVVVAFIGKSAANEAKEKEFQEKVSAYIAKH